MDSSKLKARTKAFAVEIIKLVSKLPETQIAGILGKQLTRCGTSVGANYRSSCRAKSRADFISKMGIVEEEADEAVYWMELLVESGLIKADSITELLKEADELIAIAVSSIKTARKGCAR